MYLITIPTHSPELYARLQTLITQFLHVLDEEATTASEKRTIAFAINEMKREMV